MPSLGGSAALNGFLYQILANLNRISEIRLSTTLDGANIQSALLILEPKGGGGDARYIGSNIRIVEQYKTRSLEMTWSLKEIIEEVLPDLYRAIDIDYDSSEYHFVTNGRLGRMNHFFNFLQILKSINESDNIVAALDDSKEYAFFNNGLYTFRSLFLHITNIAKNVDARADQATLYKKVGHLLAKFSIQEKRSENDFIEGIDEFLFQVVDRQEEIPSKRNELCGILLNLSAQGDVVFSPENILERAGLAATPLTNFESLTTKLRSVLNEFFLIKDYNSAMDVRSAPQWPIEKPILILAGDSGQGKTWQLCKLADQLLSAGQTLSLISATDNADDDLQRACDVIWLRGLSHDSSIQLERLAYRYNTIFRSRHNFYQVVLIDDIQKMEEAKNLISKPLKQWGIRLVFTAPLSVGRILASSNPDVFLMEVPDFTVSELCDCLERKGYVWDEIPADVRSNLCKPILADIYCKIANPSSWSPHNEYELYETYWKRITIERTQYDHPGDREILLKLVGAFIKGDCNYPWPLSYANDVGLQSDTILRIESIGWLRRCGRADIEIPHDRLLSWAVAEWLINQRGTGAIEFSEDIQKLFIQFYDNEPLFKKKSLSYVPMDYLWLASDPNNGVKGDVSILLKLFEEQKAHGGYPEGYYLELITTLGERILPALKERIQSSISQKDNSFTPRLINEAIIKIGKKFPDPVKSIGMSFINSDVVEIQEAGSSIIEEYPDVKAIDCLWGIHKINHHCLEAGDGHERITRYEKSFNALRECLQINPEWLIDKMKSVDPNSEPISELGWLLLNIKDYNNAKKIWFEIKQIFITKVQDNKRRSLARCIGRFKDEREVTRLCQLLDCKDDLADMAAFSILCQLDWNMALESLEKLDEGNIIFTRNWWLPQLFAKTPTKASERLLYIAKNKNNSLNYLRCIYSGHENLIDVVTLHLLLEALESILSEQIIQIQNNSELLLRLPLDFIAKINNPELLKVFESKANTRFDDLLSQVAQSRLERLTEWFDHILADAESILCKIYGKGLTDLINAALGSKNEQARLWVARMALRRPDAKTSNLLRHIVLAEENDNFDSLSPLKRTALRSTIEAMAALGDEDAVIYAVQNWGEHLSWSIFDLYKPGNQLSLDCFIKAGEKNVLNLLLLVGLSGNKYFIPWLISLLKENPPENKITKYAAISLSALGETGNDFLGNLKEILETKENQLMAINILLDINTSEALLIVADYLHNFDYSFIEKTLEIATNLFKRKETKEKARQFVLDNHKSWSFCNSSGRYLEILPEINCPDVRDILIEEAFANNVRYAGRIIYAIKGLWKIDQQNALRAVKYNLKNAPTIIKDQIPGMLVALSEEYAIEILCKHIPLEETTSTRWSICRALRSVQEKGILKKYINSLFTSSNRSERAAAVELIGWQDIGFIESGLEEISQNDFDETVCKKSIEALKQLEEQEWIRELMKDIKSAPKFKQWSLLDSIIALGDPYILSDKRDSLWLGQILNDNLPEYASFAKHLIKNRKEEVSKKAKDIDFRRRN